MDTALIEEFDEWSMAAGRVLARIDGVASDREELAVATWSVLIESFTTHRRMWAAVVREFLSGEDPAEVGLRLGYGPTLGQRGLAAILADVTEGLFDDGEPGAFDPMPAALLVGVAVQWLTDPGRAPSACEVVESILTLRGHCCDPLHNPALGRYDAGLGPHAPAIMVPVGAN